MATRLEDEKRIRARVISLLTDLINSPKIYKKAEFAQRYHCCEDTISDDFVEMRNAGFQVDCTFDFRYFIDFNASFTHLQRELYFTADERLSIEKSLVAAGMADKQLARILRKLGTLLDVSKVANQVLNKVHLEKINALQKACDEKQKVALINYRSSSSKTTADRIVEAYHINPKEDLIYAYDYNRKRVLHFKINRIERIRQLHEDWEKEGTHRNARRPDAFGIVPRNLLPLHIRMNVSAYNYLLERFPGTQGHCNPCPTDADKFDLECEVNDEFIGVSSFLIGYHEHIETVFEPDALIEHLNEKVKKISF